MKKVCNCTSLILIIGLAVIIGCSPKINSVYNTDKKVEITADISITPVLKRKPVNPLLRLRIYVPAEAGAQTYQSVVLHLPKETINNVSQLLVYDGGTEPKFNSSLPVDSIKPQTSEVEIPVKISANPGLHYIWIAATLKEDANIDEYMQIDAVGVKDSTGTILSLESTGLPLKKRTGIALRLPGDDGVNSYRIPGIVQTNKGTLLSVYDIRYKHSGDLPANIDVGLSRSTDGGHTWEPMKVIMDMGEPHENNGVGDPSILFDPVTNKIWVAALWSKGNRSIAGSEPGISPDTTGQFVLVSSDDDGLTWSAPYSITSQVKDPKWHLYFNGPGNGIAMSNGTLVFPSQYWDESKKPGIPHAAIIYSDDHGKTWKTGTGAKSNTTESQVVETADGTLMLNMRDNRGRYRSVATTKDMGKTWVEHATSYKDLPDPVCMASIIKANVKVNGEKKDVLFFSNPHTHIGRYNMTIQASLDLGETWLDVHSLLLDENEGFGYSCLTKIDDETIGILFEGVRDLYFMRIPVREIINDEAITK